MDFAFTTARVDVNRTACAVVGVYQDGSLPPAASEIDSLSKGALSKLIKAGDVTATLGKTQLLHGLQGVPAERILMVGCGTESELDDARYAKILAAASASLRQTGARDATFYLAELRVPGRDLFWQVRHLVQKACESAYQFDQLKTEHDKDNKNKQRLRKINLCLPRRFDSDHAKRALQEGMAIASGMALAKDLGNLPPNVCTPRYLADTARALEKENKSVAVTVLNEGEMKKLGMGALLCVARGSREPPRLIAIEYRGGHKSEAPVVLVGKGVTFDSGGISIKPADKLDEMKFDMCGAASVLGTLKAVLELALPVNVVGIIPACENLPSGTATKPGDIVTSLSKQTVEILNTDAEGRLLLCDALTYAKRFKPTVVIDIATLTGACVIALGAHASGLFTNDEELADALLTAGSYAGDRAWRLPLWEEYAEQLKSNFADVANIGSREGGAIVAARFLARFTEAYRWAHLDIAGTAWRSGDEKGANGRPVPLLTQYLLDWSSTHAKSA
ncbi:MAG: leucyl aminopeptidase [Gammaproteobacteria bacterium]|jgi:leucyl aminopeptidase